MQFVNLNFGLLISSWFVSTPLLNLQPFDLPLVVSSIVNVWRWWGIIVMDACVQQISLCLSIYYWVKNLVPMFGSFLMKLTMFILVPLHCLRRCYILGLFLVKSPLLGFKRLRRGMMEPLWWQSLSTSLTLQQFVYIASFLKVKRWQVRTKFMCTKCSITYSLVLISFTSLILGGLLMFPFA